MYTSKKKIKKVSLPFKPKGLVPKLLNIFYYKKEGKDKNNLVDIWYLKNPTIMENSKPFSYNRSNSGWLGFPSEFTPHLWIYEH